MQGSHGRDGKQKNKGKGNEPVDEETNEIDLRSSSFSAGFIKENRENTETHILPVSGSDMTSTLIRTVSVFR